MPDLMAPQLQFGSSTPDRLVMFAEADEQSCYYLAMNAVQHARLTMPRVSGSTARRLQPVSGEGWFGIYFPDRYTWFLEHGTKPFTMRSLAGKSQPVNEFVLTPYGWRTMGAIAVGDPVIGSDGKSTEVTGVFPQGILECFRVTFSDRTSVRCSADHLWQAKRSRSGNSQWEVRTTEYLRTRLKARWRVGLVKPVQFEGLSRLPVDPYLLGALLGDGNLTGSSPCLSAKGEAVVNEVRAVLPEGLEIRKASSLNYSWSIISGRRGTRSNHLSQALRQLGMNGLYSHEKYIPAVYMAAPENDRLALLQGLLDTDGLCDRKLAGVRFHTCSAALADNVADLVRGLGGRAYVYNDDGRKGTRRQMYTVGIVMPQDLVPFRAQMTKRLHRYLASSTRRPALGKTIVSIEPDGFEEMQCISVAAEDRLYVTSGYTLTHNTIPMWVSDEDGSLRTKNPKIKTRRTEDGRLQVLIFRRAARQGQRKFIRRPNKWTGVMETVSVPLSYPGAPGRIGSRVPAGPPGGGGGQIARGNVGVRWRHPGLRPMQFLNSAIAETAFGAGLFIDDVYATDGAGLETLIEQQKRRVG